VQNDAELIQMTLALAEWQEAIDVSRRHHARAEERAEELAAKPGAPAAGSALVVRDLREAAIQHQRRALAALGRAMDAADRSVREYGRLSSLDALLGEHLNATLRDYLTLQRLAGHDDLVEITTELWLAGGRAHHLPPLLEPAPGKVTGEVGSGVAKIDDAEVERPRYQENPDGTLSNG